MQKSDWVALVAGGGAVVLGGIGIVKAMQPLSKKSNNPHSNESLVTTDKREVYIYKTSSDYQVRAADAESYAQQLGGTLATLDQLEQAFKKGGQWCEWAWVKDTSNNRVIAANVMQEIKDERHMCGIIGVNVNEAAHWAHVAVYGVKPSKESACTSTAQMSCVLPFSSYKKIWSEHELV